jgi:hypothetical protein
MKKLMFALLITACTASSVVLLSFTKSSKPTEAPKKVAAAGKNGVLYVKIKGDPNKGKIHIKIHSPFAGGATLYDGQLGAGETLEKTFTGLNNGPQQWYLVSFDWPQTDFHNMSASTGNTIAWGTPVNANNAVLSWQIAGTGAFGSVPVLLP